MNLCRTCDWYHWAIFTMQNKYDDKVMTEEERQRAEDICGECVIEGAAGKTHPNWLDIGCFPVWDEKAI